MADYKGCTPVETPKTGRLDVQRQRAESVVSDEDGDGQDGGASLMETFEPVAGAGQAAEKESSDDSFDKILDEDTDDTEDSDDDEGGVPLFADDDTEVEVQADASEGQAVQDTSEVQAVPEVQAAAEGSVSDVSESSPAGARGGAAIRTEAAHTEAPFTAPLTVAPHQGAAKTEPPKAQQAPVPSATPGRRDRGRGKGRSRNKRGGQTSARPVATPTDGRANGRRPPPESAGRIINQSGRRGNPGSENAGIPQSEPHSFAPRHIAMVQCQPPPRFPLGVPGPGPAMGPAMGQGPMAGALVRYNGHSGYNGNGPNGYNGNGYGPNGHGYNGHGYNGNGYNGNGPYNGHGYGPNGHGYGPNGNGPGYGAHPADPFGNQYPMPPYAPVPPHVRALRSAHLNRLTEGPAGRPSLSVALDPDNFPFIDSTSQAEPANYGVLKIKNIPFSTTRTEIIAFLGRNSRILNDMQEPVHIIMERVTGKTHDAYVEFLTMHDAMRAAERHTAAGGRAKLGRLGDRPVEVELSGQAALMRDLFPLAAGVFWNGAQPEIQAPVAGEPWSRFKGFITEEEMTMLVKHVEVPHRSLFSRDCPQRPFECMISTIKKVPWYMAAEISVRQRHAVYRATVDLVRLLQAALKDRRHEQHLTPQLLRRLVTAGMLCPGFTATMKDDLAYAAGLDEAAQLDFNQPRFADSWNHAYSLAPKPGVALDVLEWYIAVVREETTRLVHSLGLNERAQVQQRARATDGYFGYLWFEVGLPVGPAFDQLSLAALATMEFGALERILSRAFA